MISRNHFKIYILFCIIILARVCFALEAPILESVTTTDDGGLYVVWKPVNASLGDEILGYKIILYEVKEKKARMYKLVNGNEQPGFVSEARSDEESPPILAKQILAEGADTDNIVIDYLKPNTVHEIRVLAYTKDKQSKMSKPWRVKLLSYSTVQAIAHRHTDECFLTIKSYDILTKTPEIYNNYI